MPIPVSPSAYLSSKISFHEITLQHKNCKNGEFYAGYLRKQVSDQSYTEALSKYSVINIDLKTKCRCKKKITITIII